MTKEELIEKLQALSKENDTEQAHVDADQLLLEYINDKNIEKAYHSIDKWYS